MLYALFVEPGPLAGLLPGGNVFRYVTFRTAWGMLTALAVTYAIFPRFIEWMKQKRIDQIIRTDGPESHMLNKVGTPTMGGVCILAGVTLATLVWSRLDQPAPWLVLFVMIGYGLIGFVDDWKKVMLRDPAGLAGRLKIVGQMGFGGIALAYGYWAEVFPATLSFPVFRGAVIDFEALWFGAPVLFGWLFVAFALFVLVAESNGVNLTDGLDGLAIGPTMTCAATYGAIAYLAGNTVFAEYLGITFVHGAGELSVLSFALVGAGLGFLWYNAYPAQIFMGDVGSLAIGGTLGMLAVLTKQEILLAVVGGIFLLESLSVVLQVLSFKTTGKRLFAMAPIHHHYEKLGWSEPKIIVRFWIISIVLALIGLSMLKLEVTLGSELAGKRVLVMGLARSGRAAAQLARDRGARVVGIDLQTGLDPIDGVVLELGPHRRGRFEEADLIVVSPGIPAAQADLRWAADQGKDVVGELGFALRFLPLPVVAITGTNGKSTVTHFTGQLMRAAGFRPFVGGNLGTPLCEAVGRDHDVLVLEVSSYQLELPGDLRPSVGVILNLTPDHLGRHGSMDGYAAAKAKLFGRMTADQVAVLPLGDDRLARAASAAHAYRAQLGALPGVVRERRGFRVALDGLALGPGRPLGRAVPAEGLRFSLDGFGVPGDHNLDNAATATLLAVAFGADPVRVQAALPGLTALAHRMQIVADVGGVQWIDDSKATNLDAARVGIDGLDRPAVVLLGGQGKAMPDGSFGFGALGRALGRHRAVVAFGQDGPAIADELAAVGVGAIRVANLADAVPAAAEVARPGDAVLLSPGCASFDEFRDFEHRGDQFAAWVHGRTT